MSCSAHGKLVLGFPVQESDFVVNKGSKIVCYRNLGHENSSVAKYCQYCGKELQELQEWESTVRFAKISDRLHPTKWKDWTKDGVGIHPMMLQEGGNSWVEGEEILILGIELCGVSTTRRNSGSFSYDALESMRIRVHEVAKQLLARPCPPFGIYLDVSLC